jgi:hypothetical protein
LPLIAPATTLAVTTTLDVPGVCTTACSLRQAIASIPSGGTITFDPAILPGVITLQNALGIVGKSVTIDGPGAGLLAIDGNLADRIFFLQSATLAVSGVSLIDGRTTVVDGGNAADGTGGAGGAGSMATGGCIAVPAGALVLVGVTLRNCTAQGGSGGKGGAGVASDGKAGGIGGAGGSGGVARGGAIYAGYDVTVILDRTSIVDAHAIGGNGGAGGSGGVGTFLGNGGDGGGGGSASGGAIYLETARGVRTMNVTIARSDARGGKGGNGGSSDPDVDLTASGDGGDGGAARGGLVYADNSFGNGEDFYFGFSTLGEGALTPGLHGSAGRGAARGAAGQDGAATAPMLQLLGAYPATVDHAAIFGAPGSDACLGPIQGIASVASSASCGGTPVPGVAGWFAALRLDAPAPGYRPVFAAPAIDAVNCFNRPSPTFPGPVVTADLLGTPRPQGAACDFGAIEADYVFVDGFD